MASLTHQWLLLSFDTEVVKILYHSCSICSPTPTFHFTYLLCCRHHHWQPVVHSYHKMWSLFPYHFGLWPQSCEYACAVCPYTQLFMWHLTTETDWYLNKREKETCELDFSHFPCLSFAGFLYLFRSHFCLVWSLLGCSSRPLRCKLS